MTPRGIDDLFVRYWDNTLTDIQAKEFARLLRDDPAARQQFHILCLQATAATEAIPAILPAKPPSRSGRLSRRKVLTLAGVGGGLAAAFGVGVVWPLAVRRPSGAVLVRAVGRVLIQSELASLGSIVLPGDTLTVEGVGSSAVLDCYDGSEIILAGDTVATLYNDPGTRLVVHQGGVAAEIKSAGSNPFMLSSKDVTTTFDGGPSIVTLGRFGGQTEVGVLQGRVRVSRPSGTPLLEVDRGEIGTVTSNDARKNYQAPLPTEYVWNFARPLPPGWEAGRLVPTPAGPAAEATYWTGKHAAPSYQVRSENRWTTGLVSLSHDSVVHVKYRVAEPGDVQVFIVVRPNSLADKSAAMVFDTIRRAGDNKPGEWQTVSARVAGLKTTHGEAVVPFGPPWVGFIVGVNTFHRDIGLQVAECRIARSGDPGR